MQAIRVERRRWPDTRWLKHLSLLAAVTFLFSWVVNSRPQAAAEFVERLPIPFLAPPSVSSQDWRPVRVPVRTSVVRDPSPPAASVRPDVVDAVVAATAQWGQAHRRTALFSAPDASAAQEIEIPQWSFLRILEERPGWLRVSYGFDLSGRPANVAWARAEDIGSSGPPPRYVASTRPTRLWSGESLDAEPVASVPKLALLELAGPELNGRVAVRLSTADQADGPMTWIDWTDVAAAQPPAELDLPLERPFSPFASSIQLQVPYRTQLDGSISSGSNCGPTSVAMALQSFGIYVPTSQARTIATRYMGIYDPFSGTTLESLRHVAETYGLEGLDLHENGRYKRWTLDDVRRHVRAGHPVIPQLRYRLMPGREWTWVGFDHYVVITGVDGDDFILNDPIPWGSYGQVRITAAQLSRAWSNSDAPMAGLAIARPV